MSQSYLPAEMAKPIKVEQLPKTTPTSVIHIKAGIAAVFK
jgi:hypothetical protein